MKKLLTTTSIVAAFITLSGVLIFAADESETPNYKPPLYCKDDNGVQKCFCVNDDLFADQAGIKILESLYGEVKDLWTKFPTFNDSITPSPSFITDNGTQFHYWNPSSIYLDDAGEQVKYKYSIDVNKIDIAENNSSACLFTREKVTAPNDWMAFRTWIFSLGGVFQKGLQSVGDNNYARTIQMSDEKGNATEYFLGGYIVDQFLSVTPIKKVYKFLSASDKRPLAFYTTKDIVVKSHETYEYEPRDNDGFQTACSPAKDDFGNVMNPPHGGCTVKHTNHHYKILEPSIENILSAYSIEHGVKIGDDLVFFLSQGEKMYYIAFKKLVKLPEKKVQNDSKNTHHWLEGDYNHAPYLAKEYYVSVSNEPQELSISTRHSFDLRVIQNDAKTYITLMGGTTKTITSDLQNDGSLTETLFDDLFFLEYKDGKINKTPTKSFKIPKKQKNVRLVFSDDLTKFFLFGGTFENTYYYLNIGSSFSFDAFEKIWTKIILGSTENEYSDLASVTEFGTPQPVDVFAKGMNFTYQPYGAVNTFQYPQKLSFTTNMTGIMPEVVVRVWRCGSRLRPKVCKAYAPRFIVGNTTIPIYFSHARGAKALMGDNKIFTSSKIITSVTPLTTLTRDNVISFVGNAQVSESAKINPLEELRLHSVYFIEEGEKLPIPPVRAHDTATGQEMTFKGFDGEFFNTFFKIRPVASTEQGTSLVQYGNTKYKAQYDDANGAFSSTTRNNGVGPSNSVCDYCQFSQFLFLYDLPQQYHAVTYTGEKQPQATGYPDLQNISNLSFFWNKKFSPGHHRIHMLVTATHSYEMLNRYKVMGNLVHGTNGSPMRKGAGPHSWPMEPSDLGMEGGYSQVNGPFKVYYQAYTVDFYVPEISNFSSKVGFVSVNLSEIYALDLSIEKLNQIFMLDAQDKTKATFKVQNLEELYLTDSFKNLSQDEKAKVINLWEKNQSPYPTVITSVRPVFSLEKGLSMNNVDFFMGENTAITAKNLPATHSLKSLLKDDPNRYIMVPLSSPMNDLPLNLPQLTHKAVSTDGNTKNIVVDGFHTNKAHFMRTNRDGEALFASQERLYSLENLSPDQKKLLENQGLSSSYYKVFAVVTDEQGNKIGAPPVYVKVSNDFDNAQFHLFSKKRNSILAGWKPFGILKFVQGEQSFFVRADKDGNIQKTFSSMDSVSVFSLSTDNNWEALKDEQGNDISIDLTEEITPHITNYKNGDTIFSSNPVFEGVAQPNSEVFYRIYWRQKDSNLPMTKGYFEERDEKARVQVEYGATESDASGYFAFMPQKFLSAPVNETQIYYIEVGSGISGMEDPIWNQSSITSVRYQKSSFEQAKQVGTLLSGTIQKREDYLRFNGNSYTFGLYSGTDEKPAMLRFTTPAKIKVRAGQLLALPEQSQMIVLSNDPQGALFIYPQTTQVIHDSNKVARYLREGIYTQFNDKGQSVGLLQNDVVIAPNKGGFITVVSDEVELLVPANTEIFAGKIPNTFSGEEKLFQVEATLLGNTQDIDVNIPAFGFENTQFVFSNLESIFQTECAATESLNPANIKTDSVQRCRLISEVLFPKSRDPQFLFPHNGEHLKADQKIEIAGFAWPNSVLQIVIASRHAGSVTTDKNGRFYWQAPELYNFQIPGTPEYEKMQQNGIGIDIFDLEHETNRVGIILSFSEQGTQFSELQTGVKDLDTKLFEPFEYQPLKNLFLSKMLVTDETSKDGYNRIPLFATLWDRLRHYFTEVR